MNKMLSMRCVSRYLAYVTALRQTVNNASVSHVSVIISVVASARSNGYWMNNIARLTKHENSKKTFSSKLSKPVSAVRCIPGNCTFAAAHQTRIRVKISRVSLQMLCLREKSKLSLKTDTIEKQVGYQVRFTDREILL